MNRREWLIFWAGTNAAGALFGALLHIAILVVWNMAWLGIELYLIQKLEDSNGKQ